MVDPLPSLDFCLTGSFLRSVANHGDTNPHNYSTLPTTTPDVWEVLWNLNQPGPSRVNQSWIVRVPR